MPRAAVISGVSTRRSVSLNYRHQEALGRQAPACGVRAMSDPNADRNLLFGVLALQADLIDAERFAEACSAWAARKSTPLADLMAERGWITAEERAHVEFLLDRKLRKHAGDAHQSLMEVAGAEVQGILAALDAPGIRHSLADLPRAEGHVLLSMLPTIAHTPGTRERYTLTRL